MINNNEHDYDTPIEEASTKLAKILVAKLAENKDDMIVATFDKLTPVQKQVLLEKSTDFSIDFLKEISQTDIPYPYASRCIDKLMVVLESLKRYVDGTLNQYKHELDSRVLETKNHLGKYTEELTPVSRLILKLEEVRESQGNNRNDYFNEPKAEEIVEEVVGELSTEEKVEEEVAEKASE